MVLQHSHGKDRQKGGGGVYKYNKSPDRIGTGSINKQSLCQLQAQQSGKKNRQKQGLSGIGCEKIKGKKQTQLAPLAAGKKTRGQGEGNQKKEGKNQRILKNTAKT